MNSIMEWNKDEALRAKQIAEARMQRGEFVEALKFATKAKTLCADVENIAQILAVCEVHNAALKKLSGSDMDWYAILQSGELADEATIRKQYRKLALLLHPDKNKFAGAEAAFKLIGEANGMLSDPAKRSLYDRKFKVSVRTTAPKTSSHNSNGNGNVSAAASYQNVFKSSFPGRNANQQGEQPTFWTSCNHCSTRFKYYMSVANATLRCQKCLKAFVARICGYESWGSFNLQDEIPVRFPPKPTNGGYGGKPPGGGHADTFGRPCPVSMKKCGTGVDGFVPVSKAMDSQASKNIGRKRVRESGPDSKENVKPGSGDDLKDDGIQENDVDPSRVNARKSSRQRRQVSYVEDPEDDGFEIPLKEACQNGSLNASEAEKKVPASGGLSGNNNPASYAADVPDRKRKVGNKNGPPEETVLGNKSKTDQSSVEGEEVSESGLDYRTSTTTRDNCSASNSDVPSSPEMIACPDTDFNDFEKDKAEDCFAVDQIWAVYDSTDSMPRFYAIIKKVASPFKLHISWLEPDPDDQGEIDWLEADLPIACGKFRREGSQKTTDRAMFSHQMKCVKRTGKSSYVVYPSKGETWAIFRDWDIKWSSDPESLLKYEFDYVQILSDFTENVGIEVAYLGKVKGFVSLFQKTEKNGVNVFCVLPNELFKFSHCVPSYQMTGNEREGVPRGSFELDPAALPTSLFEVGDSGDV